jgi:hypothetical protein
VEDRSLAYFSDRDGRSIDIQQASGNLWGFGSGFSNPQSFTGEFGARFSF